jgi:hypothetical protein
VHGKRCSSHGGTHTGVTTKKPRPGAGKGTGHSRTGSGTGATASDQHASGTVTDSQLDSSSFTIVDGAGNHTSFTLNDALAQTNDQLPNVCDIVTVSYHPDPSGPIADDVKVTGASTTGDCAGSSTTTSVQVDGTVVAVDVLGGSITIKTADGQTHTISADPSLLDGILAGDAVSVSYTQAPDGSLVADAVQPA